jgi:hypothetical protein
MFGHVFTLWPIGSWSGRGVGGFSELPDKKRADIERTSVSGNVTASHDCLLSKDYSWGLYTWSE